MASVEVITDVDRWRSVGDEWDALVCAARAGVYQSQPYLLSYWESPAITGKRELAICLVWNGGSLVGAAPFLVNGVFRYGVEVERRLRLLPDIHHDLIALPGYELLVGELVAKEILHERLAECLLLFDATEQSVALQSFLATMRRYGASVSECARKEKYITLLPPSFREFQAGLGWKRRSQHRKAAEAAERLGVVLEVASDRTSNLDAALEATIQLHCKRWEAVGVVTHLASPLQRQHFVKVARAFHDLRWLHLAMLKKDSRVLAASLLFFYPPAQTAYRLLDARDLAWEPFAPGKYLITSVFEHMIEAGLTRCDHGEGEQDYKKEYKPIVVHRSHTLRVIPASRYLRGPVRRILSRTVNVSRHARRWLRSPQPSVEPGVLSR